MSGQAGYAPTARLGRPAATVFARVPGEKRACSGIAIPEDPLGALSPGARAKTEEREALARAEQEEHILPALTSRESASQLAFSA